MINLLKPSDYAMNQFNNQQLYGLPTLYLSISYVYISQN